MVERRLQYSSSAGLLCVCGIGRVAHRNIGLFSIQNSTGWTANAFASSCCNWGNQMRHRNISIVSPSSLVVRAVGSCVVRRSLVRRLDTTPRVDHNKKKRQSEKQGSGAKTIAITESNHSYPMVGSFWSSSLDSPALGDPPFHPRVGSLESSHTTHRGGAHATRAKRNRPGWVVWICNTSKAVTPRRAPRTHNRRQTGWTVGYSKGAGDRTGHPGPRCSNPPE